MNCPRLRTTSSGDGTNLEVNGQFAAKSLQLLHTGSAGTTWLVKPRDTPMMLELSHGQLWQGHEEGPHSTENSDTEHQTKEQFWHKLAQHKGCTKMYCCKLPADLSLVKSLHH